MRRLFRFRILSGLFLLLVLLTVSGCRQQAEPEEDAKPTDGIYTIFYTNTEGTQLVRHKHTAVSENFDGILRELLEAFCTPDTEDVQTALPSGIRINQTAMGISEIIVDFSSEYLSLGTPGQDASAASRSRFHPLYCGRAGAFCRRNGNRSHE